MGPFATAIDKLEFAKVLQRVARYAVSDAARDQIENTLVMDDPETIRAELARVTALKRLLEVEDALPLEGMHHIRPAVQKAGVEGSILTPRELFQIGSTLRASRVLRSALHRKRDAHPAVWALVEALPFDKVLEYNIEQAIDESGAVRATASRELQSIRRAIADRYDDLRRRLESVLRGVSDLGFSQEEIITTREGRMVIPVKVEHKKRVPGFIHSASSSGATVFIEPTETLELNNEIRSLQFQEQREVDRILRELTAAVGAQRPALVQMVGILATIDVLQAKAKYSIEVIGVEPRIDDDAIVHLRDARHPLLIAHHGRQGTVPLDLDLGRSYTTLLISGPNAGGKSVALKCLGVLALMTQCGMHIPASEDAVMPVFSSMFVDIGDEQSIESDLSTFSSHLSNLKTIVRGATARSLILIDEIGTGTDPAEGGALAAAVLERLTRTGALTIATTHHGALKMFAHETPGIENGAMEFDQKTLAPTYRFRTGVPGSSYALEMADRLGFPQDLMARSRELLGSDHMRLDTLLQELEASAQEHRETTERLKQERSRAEARAIEYDAKLATLTRETKELKRKAAEDAREILERANKAIEQAVKEIREQHASKDAVRNARAQVQEVRATVDEITRAPEPEQATEPVPAGGLTPGMTVLLTGKTEPGEIEAISPDGRTATVVFGIVRMRVPLSDLEPTRKRRTARPAPTSAYPEKLEEVQRELDLRGMTGDEALPLIDKFIDAAILAGLHRVDVIHGKGTGALRRRVTEFLANHPRVRSYRLGEWNEGGTGATVIELSDQ